MEEDVPMTEAEQSAKESQEVPVTDEDVQAIIDQGEAGVADLMAAYEPIERRYFNARCRPERRA
jgi:hypothetical protein